MRLESIGANDRDAAACRRAVRSRPYPHAAIGALEERRDGVSWKAVAGEIHRLNAAVLHAIQAAALRADPDVPSRAWMSVLTTSLERPRPRPASRSFVP
jgi:hypothetical protein